MLPTVFLSLEGGDEKFVKNVQRFLPDGLAHFYPRSFENGEYLISAMEDRIGKATMFVLFASKKSLKSPWVGFEVDQARIAKIKDTTFRIIVVPIDRNVTHADLPTWMTDFWVSNVGTSPREIARYILRSLISGPLSHLPGNQVYGRGALVDTAVGLVGNVVLETEQTPNALLLAGTSGIGRRTFNRKFLAEAFSGTPQLSFGPEFVLPQFADLADIYRALRQEIETDLPLSAIADDLKTFAEAPVTTQVEEVVLRMSHFAELGQAVTIVTGNGIFEESGYLKPWVPELIRQLFDDRRIKLIVVSNRQIHENELRDHPNVLQLAVPPLQEKDIRALIIGATAALDAKPQLPSNEIIRSIGGHPSIVKATAVLVARRGPAVIDSDPSDFFALQEEILGRSLDFDNLGDIEKDILSVLSWVPQLSGDTLRRVILGRHEIKTETFAETVSGLILACLVEVAGPNYLITGPVRSLFRRLHGYGSHELMSTFSAALHDEWEAAQRDGEMRAELLDAIAYMAALEGGTLPLEFRSLLLPSTIQEVVRETYNRGHDDPEALKRVATWGLSAKTMHMDETTREEILSYVIRAYARLGKMSDPEELLEFFDQRRYRSRFYLRAFYLRVVHHDYRQALNFLVRAKEVRKYMRQVVGDLGRCYQRLGMWPQLHNLVRDQEQYIGRNSVLLDVQIGMLIAKGDFEGAERAIRVLRFNPHQETYADGRVAMLKMRRDQDFSGAQNLLTDLLQRKKGAQIYLRKLRAIAAASAGDIQTAREDSNFLKVRLGAHEVNSIEARIKLAQNDYDGAETELAKIPSLGAQEQLLRARILESKAKDSTTPFSEREQLLREAAGLRTKHQMLDEYEVGH